MGRASNVLRVSLSRSTKDILECLKFLIYHGTLLNVLG